MADKKRVTTAPLTEQEIAEALYEIPEDEFISRFDDIMSGGLDLPERLEGLITLDDYMENELREMFQSIIAQYLRPIEYAVEQVRAGDTAKRIAQEGLDALAPILSASESLAYADITENLRQIERPLRDLAGTGKRRLTKRELGDLGEAWERLDARLRPDREREPAAAPPPLSLSGLSRLDGVTAAHVRALRSAGLATLHDIASAPASDLAAVAGLPDLVAERVRAFAVGAVAVTSGSERRKAAPLPPGWMRVHVESEVFKGRLTFEYARVGRFLEPFLERLVEAEKAPAAKAKAKRAPAARPARGAKAPDKRRSS
jgi:hypothetical protein